MFTYRNASSRRLWIRRVGVEVDPGGTFQSPFEISDSNFERIEEEPKKEPVAPAKDDRP